MKKVAITQDLCRMVELMLKGGAKQKEVGKRLGISKATVSRIKTAGYDAEQYRKNTTERVEKENLAEVNIPLVHGKVLRADQNANGITVTEMEEEQVPGQICMELQPAEEQKPAEEPDAEDLQTKMMRFLGGKFGGVEKAEGLIVEKLDKIIDYMAQILRKLDG